MIFSEGLTKTFKIKGRRVMALDGVGISAQKGEVVAIVGPNGAGKTTLIKILSTLLLPDRGRAEVCGFDVIREEKEVRERIGLLTTSDRLFYFRLTGYENLLFYALHYGYSVSEARERVKYLLELVGLSQFANFPFMKYSLGMQRKLGLARALIHDPPVLLLDEPTLGIDPVSAREFRAFVSNLARAEGKTTLFSTHYLREVEEIGNRVYIIKGGKVVTQGSPETLRQRKFVLARIPFERLNREISRFVVTVDGKSVQVKAPPEIVEGIAEVEVLEEVVPSLEDIYTSLVGQSDGDIRLERSKRPGRWRE